MFLAGGANIEARVKYGEMLTNSALMILILMMMVMMMMMMVMVMVMMVMMVMMVIIDSYDTGDWW